MSTYINQKTVTSAKEDYISAGTRYLQIGQAEIEDAMKVLNYNSFKIYIYFAEASKGYTQSVSYSAVNKKFEMSRTSYKRGMADLEEYGYLVHKENNHWLFYPNANKALKSSSHKTFTSFDNDKEDEPVAKETKTKINSKSTSIPASTSKWEYDF